MKTRLSFLAVAAAFAAMTALPAAAASKAEGLVEKSRLTVENMAANEQMGPFVKKFLKNAKGVVIVPQMIKGAFTVGFEGGSGVMLVRGKDETWSYPAFYTLGAVSFGLQIGGSASEIMLLLLTDRGVKAITDGNRIKLGADLGVAAGPVGGGAEAGITLGSADVLVYSVSKGAYIGISLEGSVIEPRRKLNKAYYGVDVGSEPILVDRKYRNPHADKLRAAIARARQ